MRTHCIHFSPSSSSLCVVVALLYAVWICRALRKLSSAGKNNGQFRIYSYPTAYFQCGALALVVFHIYAETIFGLHKRATAIKRDKALLNVKNIVSAKHTHWVDMNIRTWQNLHPYCIERICSGKHLQPVSMLALVDWFQNCLRKSLQWDSFK